MFELELLTLERGITCGLKWMAAMWRGFVFESIGISSVDQQEYHAATVAGRRSSPPLQEHRPVELKENG